MGRGAEVLLVAKDIMPLLMPFFQPYNEAIEPLYLKPREMKILKRIGPPYMVQKERNLTKSA